MKYIKLILIAIIINSSIPLALSGQMSQDIQQQKQEIEKPSERKQNKITGAIDFPSIINNIISVALLIITFYLNWFFVYRRDNAIKDQTNIIAILKEKDYLLNESPIIKTTRMKAVPVLRNIELEELIYLNDKKCEYKCIQLLNSANKGNHKLILFKNNHFFSEKKYVKNKIFMRLLTTFIFLLFIAISMLFLILAFVSGINALVAMVIIIILALEFFTIDIIDQLQDASRFLDTLKKQKQITI